MTATLWKPAAPVATKPARMPRLANGDRLTAEEFDRRCANMPEDCRAELVEGVVYMSLPVFFEGHGEEHLLLAGWFANYRARTPGVRGADNATARLDGANRPQPDLTLIIDPACGGRTTIDDQGWLNGAPELAAEIANSSVSYDLGPKLQAYRRNGVQEYLVWRVEDAAIEWLRLRGDRYEPLPLGADGMLRSEVFPGLWLAPAAALNHDAATAYDALARGLASPEHAAFVADLQRRRG